MTFTVQWGKEINQQCQELSQCQKNTPRVSIKPQWMPITNKTGKNNEARIRLLYTTLLTIIFLSWGVIPEVFAGCTFLEMEEIRQEYNSPCLRWI